MSDRRVERDAATHGVADVRPGATIGNETGSRLPQVERHRCSVAMPREIRCHRVEVIEAGGERVDDVVPTPAGLCETVGKDRASHASAASSAFSAILAKTRAKVSGSWAPGTVHWPSNT